MKNKLTLLAIVFFSIATLYGRAQEVFKEGKITITYSFPEAGDKADMMKSMIGSDQVMYIKNGSIRMEMKTMMGSSIMIVNKPKGESYSVIDMMGMKYALKIDSAKLMATKKEMGISQPKVKFTNDTKQILGFNCKKAIVTSEVAGKKHSYDCWYTNDIAAESSGLSTMGSLPGIDGYMMEMTMVEKEIVIIATVTSVEKISVPDSLFELPAGYPIKSMDDLMSDLKNKKNFIPNSTDTTSSFKNYNEVPNPFTIGSELPDIEMNDVNGNPLKLSSLRGKYVLVDFWASWCGPCRVENPNVVKAYNKYKDKGFTVYSVSLDSDKTKWTKAIGKDKLAWQYHVCDFKGWASPVCNQFNIQGIPENYLIDKEGKVIAFSMHDWMLEDILSKTIK